MRRGSPRACRGRRRFVRADLRHLPFPDGAFDAVYCWYGVALHASTSQANQAALGELARVLRRGGRALVHHGNPLRLALEPAASARRTLADGSAVEEEARFDPDSGCGAGPPPAGAARRDRAGGDGHAPLLPSGGVGPARPARPGLRTSRLTSTTGVGAGPGPLELGPEAPDLIALLEKP